MGFKQQFFKNIFGIMILKKPELNRVGYIQQNVIVKHICDLKNFMCFNFYELLAINFVATICGYFFVT